MTEDDWKVILYMADEKPELLKNKKFRDLVSQARKSIDPEWLKTEARIAQDQIWKKDMYDPVKKEWV